MAERAAIVTGASSGIGLAIAHVLGEEGYALTLAARRPEKLEAAAGGLSREGLRAAGGRRERLRGGGHQAGRLRPRATATAAWTCS